MVAIKEGSHRANEILGYPTSPFIALYFPMPRVPNGPTLHGFLLSRMVTREQEGSLKELVGLSLLNLVLD